MVAEVVAYISFFVDIGVTDYVPTCVLNKYYTIKCQT